MKAFILICSLATVARCSLEPAGYRPPGSYPQSRYLPPSTSQPDNRYVPSSVGSSGHHVENYGNELSNTLVLPSKNSPVPFSQYLPANRQSSGQQIHGDNDFPQTFNPPSQYLPATEIRHSFTQALPVNDYLPPRQSQPSNAYLAPNKHSGYSSTGFSGSASGQYSSSSHGHQHNGLDQTSSGHYPSGHGSSNSAHSSSGYNYNAPENNEPAKYDFEYKVKDNYGNDYGHKEIRNGEHTQGVYTVLLPDGRRQIVHYEADSHGYRPTITYEEAGSQSGYNNQGYHY